MPTFTALDTLAPVTRFLPQTQQKGIATYFRYLRRQSFLSSVLTRAEIEAIATHGGTVVMNFEDAGASPGAFDHDIGLTDGRFARQYASTKLQAPPEAAIYFSTEARFDTAFIGSNIIPYFKGVLQAMTEPSNHPPYIIGAYSSGSVLDALSRAQLCRYEWNANALGWNGTREYRAAGRGHIWQGPTIKNFVPGLDVDPNSRAPNYTGPIGDFTLDPIQLPDPAIPPTLRYGSRGALGADVMRLQTLLRIGADGVFGSITLAAVEAFQTAHGLKADGIVGPMTWAKLTQP